MLLSSLGLVFKLHSFVTFVFLVLSSGILQISKVLRNNAKNP